MARIRTIKPDFFADEDIATLPPEARLLFVGTWLFADDEGLVRWNAAYLASQVFPYDLEGDPGLIERVRGWMTLLERGGFVLPYTATNRQRYGWIVKFGRHQKVNRPTPSKLPVPPLNDPRTALAYADRDSWTCARCSEEITLRPDSLSESLSEPLTVALQRIVRRDAGGTDYPTNVVLLHPRCSIANEVVEIGPEALIAAAHSAAGVVSLTLTESSVSHSVSHSRLEVEVEVEVEKEQPPPASQEGVLGEEVPAAEAPGTAVALFGAPAPRPKRSVGTRLDLSWKPTPDTMAWSMDQARQVGLDITREWAKFQDYWQAKAGAGGRKVDWDATWRNWIRKAVEYSPQRKAPFPHMGTTSRKIANTQALKELFR